MQMPTGIVLRCTADLVPYANNARTHTPEQVKQIASASEKIPRPASESWEPSGALTVIGASEPALFGTSGATRHFTPKAV